MPRELIPRAYTTCLYHADTTLAGDDAQAKKEEGGDGGEAEGEADPDAVGAHAVLAEPPTEGEAEQPIPDEVGDGGQANIARAAQDTKSGGLNAIEQLKGACDRKEAGGEHPDGGFFREDLGDRLSQ